MYRSGLEPAKGVWWEPVEGSEKIWLKVAFAWCLVLFAMMPLWYLRGDQNPTGIRSTVTAEAYRDRTLEFIDTYQVGTEGGLPLVEPPPGSDIYLMGLMWQWTPVLRLQQGVEYTLHLSSIDVNHGFNLYPLNVNIQVVPGYDYALRVVPEESGEFGVICNEFCGIGHHFMVGKVIVDPAEDADIESTSGVEGGDR